MPNILNKSLGSVSLTNPTLSLRYLLLLAGFLVLIGLAASLARPVSSTIGATISRMTGATVGNAPPGFAAFMGA